MEQNKNLNNEREWGFHDYISLAIRRKWIILFVFVAVFSAAVAYFMTRPPVYQASSTFIIERTESTTMYGMTPLVFESDARPIGFYTIILNSKQYRSRLFERAQNDSILQGIPNISDQLGVAFETLTLMETEYDRLYRLNVQANHPVVAFRMATIVTEEFKKRCQEIELEESRNVVEYVNVQINQARLGLAEAERELQKFKEDTRITELEQADGGILNKLAEIEAQLEDVQTRRQLAEANLSTYKMRVNEFNAAAAPYLNGNREESPRVRELRADVDALEHQKTKYEKKAVSQALLGRIDQKINEKK